MLGRTHTSVLGAWSPRCMWALCACCVLFPIASFLWCSRLTFWQAQRVGNMPKVTAFMIEREMSLGECAAKQCPAPPCPTCFCFLPWFPACLRGLCCGTEGHGPVGMLGWVDGCTWWPLEVFSTLNVSMILTHCFRHSVSLFRRKLSFVFH